MNAEQYKKVMAVIDAVTDAEPDDRQHVLSNLCADDAELRTEVERLLKQNTAAGSFMEDRPRAIADEISLIGQTIGNYRITDEIGRGGMGAVYLAERCDGAFDHQVAIKLIKRGMDSDALVRRFLNERRILATLEHPHIARLIDGGTTDDGSPYFIMEFVDGSPIDVYARERAMTVDDRLSLFALVCEAVEYAHTRQIIHRDIKPSNILVSKEGRPRLLDFGISKVVDAEDGGGSTVTETAWRLLTPEYASPEQILGNTVTSRTDVYSLGVLLCELLTGRGPYNFPSRSPLDLARTIGEQEPQLPSTLAGRQDPKTSDARPEVDHTTNTKDLKRRLRGDLDRIVLTALQKDPELRYSSAAALAADVRRHLNGQRILAPRPTVIQRFLSNFKTAVVGRWRPSFSLAAVLLVAAISFASAWGFFNRGTSAAPKVNSIAVLPFKYEGDGDPSIGPGVAEGLIASLGRTRQLDLRPLRAVMNYASAEVRDLRLIGETLRVDAVLDGTIRKTGDELEVGATFYDPRAGGVVWKYQFRVPQQDVAKVQQDVYREVVRRLSLPEDVRSTRTRNAAAYEAFLKGRFQWNRRDANAYEKAISFFDQAIEIDPEYAEAYSGLADAYALLACVIEQFDKRAERMKLARQFAEKAIYLDSTLAQPYATIGFMGWHYEWDWAGSDAAFKKAIELDPSYATAHHWYAYLLARLNRMDEAVAEIKRAQSLDPASQIIATDVGEILLYAGRYQEAIEAGAKLTELYGDDVDPWFVPGAYVLMSDFDGYVAAQQERIRLSKRDPQELIILAGWYLDNGKADEGRKLFAELRTRREWSGLKDLAIYFAREERLKRLLDGMKRDYSYRGAGVALLANHPQYAWCRSDPHVQELIRLTGTAEFARPASE